MTRSFSFPSESLPYFLGVSLLRSERVIIVSPWLSDITVEFPLSNRVDEQKLKLADALGEFSDSEFTIITNDDKHNDYIINRVAEITDVRQIDELHAKAVITDDLVYVGSANLTLSGVSNNIELCHIIENEYDDAAEYLERELNLEV